MLPRMIEDWALWLLLVGLAVGATIMGVLLVRLPRANDDVGPDERRSEADWISDTIERNGGIAPPSLVEEVLDLHAAYLRLQRPPVPPTGHASAPPVPPGAPPVPPGPAPSRVPPPPPGYGPPPPGDPRA